MEELKFILAALLIFIVRVGSALAIAGALIFAGYRLWRRWQQRTVHSSGAGRADPPPAL